MARQRNGEKPLARKGESRRTAVKRAPPVIGSPLEVFGRSGARVEGFFPTDFGCPDCRGVLYVAQLGKQGWLSFRCRVGHVFSADSLLQFKEDLLDGALFTALELMEELVQLHTVFAERDRRGKKSKKRSDFEARAARAVRHSRALRRLIRNEGTAPLPRQTKRAYVD